MRAKAGASAWRGSASTASASRFGPGSPWTGSWPGICGWQGRWEPSMGLARDVRVARRPASRRSPATSLPRRPASTHGGTADCELLSNPVADSATLASGRSNSVNRIVRVGLQRQVTRGQGVARHGRRAPSLRDGLRRPWLRVTCRCNPTPQPYRPCARAMRRAISELVRTSRARRAKAPAAASAGSRARAPGPRPGTRRCSRRSTDCGG